MNKEPKKKFAERVYDAIFGSETAGSSGPPRKGGWRSYGAARVTRGNANWGVSPTGANYEIRLSLAALRARARQAARDDGHIKKFLSLARSNIIGPKGIQLQCQAMRANGQPNVKLNQMVEQRFWEWSHAETCTLSGKLDWRAVQRLVVTRLATDGEFLVQMVETDRDFGLSLKVWDVNWLDETFNETRPDGNRVIMSVEVDANDRPVAYWLTTPASEMNYTQRRERTRTRMPADQFIHGFLVYDDETQTRGVTWFHAALLDAKNYRGYADGVIQSARFYSNIPIFLESAVTDGDEWTGPTDDNGEAIDPVIDVSSLAVNLLPQGMKMNQLDPKQPTQNHPAFAKTVLMGLAAALDLPYFSLAGDMEAVNFSSSRVGLDESRDVWRALQDFVATTLHRRVYQAWIKRAILMGKVTVTSPRDLDEIMNPQWKPRGWKYIDPTKDVTADKERLKYRLATPSQILGEQGIDYSDYLQQWRADKELAAQYGIDIDAIYTETGPAVSSDTNAAGDPPPAEA